MDRSMKVMFGMMTVAICLLAITMMGNQSQQAYAGEYVSGGDRGDAGPTIVWMGVTSAFGNAFNQNNITICRMWSDGTMQIRPIAYDHNCEIINWYVCGDWIDVPPPAGGDGIACSADVNNDMQVNVTDVLAVMSSWGSNVECEPTYECIDLNNLPSGMGG